MISDSSVERTERGFPYIKFSDAYQHPCIIQQSSATDDTERGMSRPGTSFLWIGTDDAAPQILASEAAAHGVKTNEMTGWVPYPIPANVLLTTRMHLHRDHVSELIEVLQRWLETGTLEE